MRYCVSSLTPMGVFRARAYETATPGEALAQFYQECIRYCRDWNQVLIYQPREPQRTRFTPLVPMLVRESERFALEHLLYAPIGELRPMDGEMRRTVGLLRYGLSPVIRDGLVTTLCGAVAFKTLCPFCDQEMEASRNRSPRGGWYYTCPECGMSLGDWCADWPLYTSPRPDTFCCHLMPALTMAAAAASVSTSILPRCPIHGWESHIDPHDEKSEEDAGESFSLVDEVYVYA